MAAMVRGRGPKDTKKTVLQLMRYLGRHKLALIAVAVMVFIGSGANIFGTYLLKPVINQYVLPGDVGGLLTVLLMMGVMYLAGVTATWGYNQLSKNWENTLTDTDGQYAELMAGSYTDNQPNFSWLEPYETKEFSQYWYPISKIGIPDYANLRCAAIRFSLSQPKCSARCTQTARYFLQQRWR